MTEERVAVNFCPYCASEDLRPSEAGHGAWECRECARAFAVRFIGLVVGSRSPASGVSVSGPGVTS